MKKILLALLLVLDACQGEDLADPSAECIADSASIDAERDAGAFDSRASDALVEAEASPALPAQLVLHGNSFTYCWPVGVVCYDVPLRALLGPTWTIEKRAWPGVTTGELAGLEA